MTKRPGYIAFNARQMLESLDKGDTLLTNLSEVATERWHGPLARELTRTDMETRAAGPCYGGQFQ